MKVYYGLENLKKFQKPVITTGTFDGVHNGHQKILSNLTHIAKTINGESVVITFNPHPRLVLFPENNNLKLLNAIDEKVARMESLGINHLVIHKFTKEFSRLTALEYIRDILVNQLGLNTLVIGYDHHFGRNREGSFEELTEFSKLYDFKIEQISALDIENVNVSSTKIRKALAEGDVEKANNYLGYHYPISGKIVKGDGIGKTISFPTANILVDDPNKLIPAKGVYACRVLFEGKTFNSMINIGVRPTINNLNKEKIELHIFNFSADIYNQSLKIELVKKLRNEQKFNSLEDLKQQLKLDKENATVALIA